MGKPFWSGKNVSWLLVGVLITLGTHGFAGNTPEAIRGTLDLRGHDFETIPTVRLKGQWAFSFGAWVSSNGALSQYARLPHRWTRAGLPAVGKATYRLHLSLPPHRGEPWALGIGEGNVFHHPIQIYANGQLIHFANEPKLDTPSNRYARFTGWSLLPEEEQIDLLVFVENMSDSRGGRLDDFLLGPQSSVVETYQRRVSNKIFSLGMMALGAVIFLVFFAMMPSSASSLYFSLFCGAMMMRMVSNQDRIFESVFATQNLPFWNRFEQIGTSLTVLCFLLYLFSLYRREGWLIVNRTLIAVYVTLVAGMMALPAVLASHLVPIFHGAALLSGVYAIVVLIRAIHRKQEGSLILLLGFAVVFASLTNDILYANSIIHTGVVSQYAVSFFVICMSTLLVYRHVRHIHQVRKSARETLAAREALLLNRAELLQVETDRLYTDPLTHLPNGARLDTDLKKNPGAGLLVVDFAGMEEHERFYGQKSGQALLLGISVHLQVHATAHAMKLYRLSGARFGFCLEQGLDARGAETLLPPLKDWISRPIYLGSLHFDLAFRIAATSGGERIMEKIEKAFQVALREHREWAWCDTLNPEGDEFEQNHGITMEMAAALDENRITLFYQPILQNGTLVFDKHEALVRLRRRDGTILSPAAFLPAARASGLYGAMTRQVIRLAFERLTSAPGSISINLSIRDLVDPATRDVLSECLRRPEAGQVVVELLESDGMGDYRRVSDFIEEAKGHGAKIAIDDFGSGYSNFEHLLRMQVDIIKIDGSLIRNLDQDVQAQVLVSNIVDFSKKLGLVTVAEFVHSPAIFQKVRDMGIDYTQGNYLGAASAQGRFGERHILT